MAEAGKPHDYATVEQENRDSFDDASIELELKEDLYSSAPPRRPRRIALILSILLNILLFIVAGVLFWMSSTAPPRRFTTDFPSISAADIGLTNTIANGRFEYDRATRKVSLSHPSNGTRLFGPPSKEVDKAWHELMGDEFMSLSDAEGVQLLAQIESEGAIFRDQDFEKVKDVPHIIKNAHSGHYVAELSVFHSLHCLDAIRKSMHEDYYKTAPTAEDIALGFAEPADWREIHVEHCFENIFHALKCASDLTPVPLYRYPGIASNIGVALSHTCRNFDNVRGWIRERHREDPNDADDQGAI